MYVLKFRPALPVKPDFTVAIATVNRPITARFKGYFGFLAAPGTNRREHLTSRTVVIVSVTIRLPCLTAFGTAFWLISIAPRLVKLLILSAESEGSPAIGALE